jgi:hypothetical protein
MIDIDKIRQILNSDANNEAMEFQILAVIAKDKDAIPSVMKMLAEERDVKRKLISDMNTKLSLAHTYIDERIELKEEQKKRFNKGFVMEQIAIFYKTYANYIEHAFNYRF